MIDISNISVPLYKFKGTLIITTDFKDALVGTDLFKEFASEFDNDQAANSYLKGAGAMTMHFEESNFFIVMVPRNIKEGSIAHEAFHLTCMIMKEKGISYCDNSEEAFAYLLDYIVNIITKRLKKINNAEK